MSTDRDMGSSFSWWVGRVVSVSDPHQSGRLRVRILGRHDDTTNIPDDSLPWAIPLQSITSASIGRIGSAPVGAVVGSRVFGMWLDNDQQYPLVMGTIGKSGDAREGQVDDGAPSIDTSTGSITPASVGSANNAYSALANTRIDVASVDSGQRNIDSVALDGVNLTQAAANGALFSTLPTTASADRSATDIVEVVRQVDPNSTVSSLPCLPPGLLNFSIQLDLSGLTAGLVSSLRMTIRNAILQLANELGLWRVLSELNSVAMAISDLRAMLALLSGIRVCGVSPLNNGFTDPAMMALGQSLAAINTAGGFIAGLPGSVDAAASGLLNQYVAAPLARTSNIMVFVPSTVVQAPPTGYVQNYYSYDDDPYPGYIRWTDQYGSGNEVFTSRNGEPNYSSAAEHTRYATQNSLVSSLRPMIINGNISPNLFVSLLSATTVNYRAFGSEKIVGYGLAALGVLAVARTAIPTIYSVISNSFQPNFSTQYVREDVGEAVNRFTQKQAELSRRAEQMRVGVST